MLLNIGPNVPCLSIQIEIDLSSTEYEVLLASLKREVECRIHLTRLSWEPALQEF